MWSIFSQLSTASFFEVLVVLSDEFTTLLSLDTVFFALSSLLLGVLFLVEELREEVDIGTAWPLIVNRLLFNREAVVLGLLLIDLFLAAHIQHCEVRYPLRSFLLATRFTSRQEDGVAKPPE